MSRYTRRWTMFLAADWFKVVQLDTLDEIRCFAGWANRLGSGERDLGGSERVRGSRTALCDGRY